MKIEPGVACLVASALVSIAAAPPPAKSNRLIIQPERALYPAEVLAAGLEGDVDVTLEVSATGELACRAKAGGALAPLKRPSCMLIAQRDIFGPSTDASGKPAPASYEATVRWRVATDNSQFGGAIPISRENWVRHFDHPPEQLRTMITGKVKVEFAITPFGRVGECRVVKTSYSTNLDAAVCPLLLKRAVFLPALAPDGSAQAARGWFNVNWANGGYHDDFSVDGGP
ncbi:energy transducer TonB [Sphingomonas sp. UYAg733]